MVNALQASSDGRWLAAHVSREAPMFGVNTDSELWVVQASPTPVVRYRGAAAGHLHFDRASSQLLAVTDSAKRG